MLSSRRSTSTAASTTSAQTITALVALVGFSCAKKRQRSNKYPPGLTWVGPTTPPTSKNTMLLKAMATRLKRIMLIRLKTFMTEWSFLNNGSPLSVPLSRAEQPLDSLKQDVSGDRQWSHRPGSALAPRAVPACERRPLGPGCSTAARGVRSEEHTSELQSPCN